MTRTQLENQRLLLNAVGEGNPGGFISLPFSMAEKLFEMAEAYLDLTETAKRGGYAAEEQG